MIVAHEKEDAAFGIFMTGTFAMMMPGKNINRKGMVSSRDNAKLVYQAAKKSLMGDKLSKQICYCKRSHGHIRAENQ